MSRRRRIGEIGEPKRGNKSIRMYKEYSATTTATASHSIATIHIVLSSRMEEQEYHSSLACIAMYMYKRDANREVHSSVEILCIPPVIAGWHNTSIHWRRSEWVGKSIQEGEHDAKEMQISSIYYLYHLLCVWCAPMWTMWTFLLVIHIEWDRRASIKENERDLHTLSFILRRSHSHIREDYRVLFNRFGKLGDEKKTRENYIFTSFTTSFASLLIISQIPSYTLHTICHCLEHNQPA